MLGFSKEKFDKFLIKRVIILFILFFIINIIANLSSLNYYTEIFSHFKLHYFYLNLIFIILFLYLLSADKKSSIGILLAILLIFLNITDLHPYFIRHSINSSKENVIKLGLFNVLTSNKKYNMLLDEIKKENPSIVILQEVDENWLIKMNYLKETYPYFIEHPRNDNFGIALYSKIPFKKANIEYWTERKIPVINTVINKDNKEINIYAIHTLPPVNKDYFNKRNEMFKTIYSIINSNNYENLIIAGDFNSTAFSPYYKKYIKSTGIKDSQTIAGNINEGSWNTFHPFFFRITVEHILSSKNLFPIKYSQGKYFGSDHFPVYVEIEIGNNFN